MRQGKGSLYMAVAAFLLIMGLSVGPAWGAVGCELNNADRDVPRLFPGSTSYEPTEFDMRKIGGKSLAAKVEAKLRNKLHGLYETIDVPYTLYEVFNKNQKIGYIHGVTQKGQFGGINIFLVMDLDLRIKTIYIQKMSGEYADKFRSPEFAKQYVGLTLEDFESYDVITGKGTGKLAGIKNPAPEAELDFRYIQRGIKKNLILVNEFIRVWPASSSKSGTPAK